MPPRGRRRTPWPYTSAVTLIWKLSSPSSRRGWKRSIPKSPPRRFEPSTSKSPILRPWATSRGCEIAPPPSPPGFRCFEPSTKPSASRQRPKRARSARRSSNAPRPLRPRSTRRSTGRTRGQSSWSFSNVGKTRKRTALASAGPRTTHCGSAFRTRARCLRTPAERSSPNSRRSAHTSSPRTAQQRGRGDRSVDRLA